MKVKRITELTVEELQVVISNTVNAAIKDSIEDIMALSSDNYIKSIKEAREDYKKGRTKSFEEVFNV
ncbi:MAG: hypothetical protein ACYDDB_04155 [bacterium]